VFFSLLSHGVPSIKLHILENFTLYLRNSCSLNLRAIENCICGLRSIGHNMRSILRTVWAAESVIVCTRKHEYRQLEDFILCLPLINIWNSFGLSLSKIFFIKTFLFINRADKENGIRPGFGATINIINGGLECNTKDGKESNQALNR
jgi:hypothetical protein